MLPEFATVFLLYQVISASNNSEYELVFVLNGRFRPDNREILKKVFEITSKQYLSSLTRYGALKGQRSIKSTENVEKIEPALQNWIREDSKKIMPLSWLADKVHSEIFTEIHSEKILVFLADDFNIWNKSEIEKLANKMHCSMTTFVFFFFPPPPKKCTAALEIERKMQFLKEASDNFLPFCASDYQRLSSFKKIMDEHVEKRRVDESCHLQPPLAALLFCQGFWCAIPLVLVFSLVFLAVLAFCLFIFFALVSAISARKQSTFSLEESLRSHQLFMTEQSKYLVNSSSFAAEKKTGTPETPEKGVWFNPLVVELDNIKVKTDNLSKHKRHPNEKEKKLLHTVVSLKDEPIYPTKLLTSPLLIRTIVSLEKDPKPPPIARLCRTAPVPRRQVHFSKQTVTTQQRVYPESPSRAKTQSARTTPQASPHRYIVPSPYVSPRKHSRSRFSTTPPISPHKQTQRVCSQSPKKTTDTPNARQRSPHRRSPKRQSSDEKRKMSSSSPDSMRSGSSKAVNSRVAELKTPPSTPKIAAAPDSTYKPSPQRKYCSCSSALGPAVTVWDNTGALPKSPRKQVTFPQKGPLE